MHVKKILIAALLSLHFAACNNAAKDEKTVSLTITTESREQILYKETMNIHNEVMAKMGKLNGYKKKVQQQADSIKSMLAFTDFPRPVAQRISYDLDTLITLGKKLATADSAMNAWMEGFDPDPKLPTTEAKADYFEGQKQRAEAMKKVFFKALAEAEKKFNPGK